MFFIGIVVLNKSFKLCIMQQMYTLNLLSEAGMLARKTADNPMEPNTKPTKDDETGPLYMYA